jgi:hypothetical protein
VFYILILDDVWSEGDFGENGMIADYRRRSGSFINSRFLKPLLNIMLGLYLSSQDTSTVANNNDIVKSALK